jgi:hypothetical protein
MITTIAKSAHKHPTNLKKLDKTLCTTFANAVSVQIKSTYLLIRKTHIEANPMLKKIADTGFNSSITLLPFLCSHIPKARPMWLVIA